MEKCSVFYEKEHSVLSRDEFPLTYSAGQMPAKQKYQQDTLCTLTNTNGYVEKQIV